MGATPSVGDGGPYDDSAALWRVRQSAPSLPYTQATLHASNLTRLRLQHLLRLVPPRPVAPPVEDIGYQVVRDRRVVVARQVASIGHWLGKVAERCFVVDEGCLLGAIDIRLEVRQPLLVVR